MRASWLRDVRDDLRNRRYGMALVSLLAIINGAPAGKFFFM
jgi:hypothetical protein